jgi:hypothetical protein
MLQHIERTNKRVYRNLLRHKAFPERHDATTDSLTIEFAFDSYIQRRFTNKITISNWNGTKKKLVAYFGDGKLLADVTLIEMKECFAKLRSSYAAATLHKDARNVKQLWAECLDNRQIAENLMAKFRFDAPTMSLVAKKTYVDPVWFEKALAAITSKQQRALLGYYRYMGARQSDPKGDRWEDIAGLDTDRPLIRRSNCKNNFEKLPDLCPIPGRLADLLRDWRDESLKRELPITGLIFPWLFASTSANQFSYFKRQLIAKGVPVWPNFFNSLRASRSMEIRALPNGRRLEMMWIGHRAEVADLHYDVNNTPETQRFYESEYYSHVWGKRGEQTDRSPPEHDVA